MNRLSWSLAAMLFASLCWLVGWRVHQQVPRVKAAQRGTNKPTKNDCLTEPNGDKIWYPDMNPFYAEGARVNFESWPAICKEGNWITDVEQFKRTEEIERPRRELLNALKTRALSVSELKRVMQYGSRILVEESIAFRQADIDAQFSHFLEMQKLLQGAAILDGLATIDSAGRTIRDGKAEPYAK